MRRGMAPASAGSDPGAAQRCRHHRRPGRAGAQPAGPGRERAARPGAADPRPVAHPDPAGFRQTLLEQLSGFEQAAAKRGIKPETVLVARYALCTLLDEAVLLDAVGRERAVDEAEPARHVLPRDRRRREVLSAAQQDGRAAGREHRAARVLLRLPRARLRRPLPRDRRRQGAARADPRAPLRAHPQAAPARGGRSFGALERHRDQAEKALGGRSCCG